MVSLLWLVSHRPPRPFAPDGPDWRRHREARSGVWPGKGRSIFQYHCSAKVGAREPAHQFLLQIVALYAAAVNHRFSTVSCDSKCIVIIVETASSHSRNSRGAICPM